MIIRPIGQSGYILKTESTEIIIDPYLSDIVEKVAGRKRLLPSVIAPESITADAVICTHNHLDHLDTEAVEKMPKGTLFITTNEGKEVLLGLNQTNATALTENESITVGDFNITAVYALHTVEAFGLIIKAENKTLYFSGDTLFSERLFKIKEYNPDYTFICINGRLGNMNVGEAITVAHNIGAKINVPNHYDMFASNSENPHLFANNIKGGLILEFNKEYRL